MFDCRFELNNQPMSKFQILTASYPAFSGLGREINNRSAACLQNVGPIPVGPYYIVDRESGGLLGPLWDRIKGRTDWFALYAIDNAIDDRTYCKEVERGNFRLHPEGPSGLSKGCIVIKNRAHFNRVRSVLKSVRPITIPGTKHMAYGKVEVK